MEVPTDFGVLAYKFVVLDDHDEFLLLVLLNGGFIDLDDHAISELAGLHLFNAVYDAASDLAEAVIEFAPTSTTAYE
jgi:hypothetical protein